MPSDFDHLEQNFKKKMNVGRMTTFIFFKSFECRSYDDVHFLNDEKNFFDRRSYGDVHKKNERRSYDDVHFKKKLNVGHMTTFIF